MPPKGADKSKQKERDKIAVDKTFGLKNKNKSKVVQKYIKNITQNSKGESRRVDDAERKEKEAKQKTMANTALMNSLFNKQTDKKGRAYDPVAKKQAKQAEEEMIASGGKLKEAVKKEIIEGIANSIQLTNPKGVRMSELGGHPIIHTIKEKHQDAFKTLQMLLFIKANDKVFWVSDKEDNNPMIRCQEDVDAEVEPDERPIEEIIEERRRALPPGGTPVTPETFKAWKERKEAERLVKVESDRQELAKKTGGKGLAALSGKDLFTYDASLFVDDDGAADADEYDDRSEKEDSDEEEDEKKAKHDDDSDEEDADGEDGEGGGQDADASGSAEPAKESEVTINKDLFLNDGDLPDDLDDLDDD